MFDSVIDQERSAAETTIWTEPRKELWARIERHNFEPDHPLNFTKRLARDRGWSLDQGRVAIKSYKRFCLLAVTSLTPMTPSETVDEVWHQHLIYSRDYWDVWCKDVLGKPLHHDPTPGSPEAQMRYRQQYAETILRYEQLFGPANPAVWPATHERFATQPRYQIVDRNDFFILPKGKTVLRHIFKRSSRC